MEAQAAKARYRDRVNLQAKEDTVRLPTSRQGLDTTTKELCLATCLIFLSLLSMGCCKATSFSRGEPMLLGPYSLSFSSAQAATDSDGNKELSVLFRWVRVDSGQRPKLMLNAGPRMLRFRIVDSEGQEYKHSRMRPGPGSKDIIVAFKVPQRSHGFTVQMTNPARRKGQPCAATVPLGR